ncbi:hypothetical protein [Qipengyuania gelatinilytica]|nr:hypothetical protein [Qipengyuania gelatinilytica]
MPRLTTHFAAAFAALAITVMSLQTVTSVPAAQVAILAAPAIA